MTSGSLPCAFLPLLPALTKYPNSGSEGDPMQHYMCRSPGSMQHLGMCAAVQSLWIARVSSEPCAGCAQREAQQQRPQHPSRALPGPPDLYSPLENWFANFSLCGLFLLLLLLLPAAPMMSCSGGGADRHRCCCLCGATAALAAARGFQGRARTLPSSCSSCRGRRWPFPAAAPLLCALWPHPAVRGCCRNRSPQPSKWDFHSHLTSTESHLGDLW